jgi:hypothetical protein
MSIKNCTSLLRCDFAPTGEHPDFPVSEWKDEVLANRTRESYYDWLEDQLDQRDDALSERPYAPAFAGCD